MVVAALRTPRLSIVTPCLNRVDFIDEAIESVVAQKYPALEHIVVDGGSTDGTLQRLARYPHLRVISEPDQGLYDALNKGLRMATGEIIGHLNSDDAYAAGAFEKIVRAFADPEVDAVYCGADVIESTGGRPLAEGRLVRRFIAPDEIALSFANLTHGVPITNARVFRRTIFDRVGYIDLRYRIASDRDFLLRVARVDPKAALLDSVVYLYRMHPGSLTITRDPERERRARAEYLAIAEELLADGSLSKEARRCCIHWHSRESAAGAVAALQRADWREARAFCAQGFRADRMWPVVLCRHLGGSVLGRNGGH
jgi:glycosyltransferase involved in cell wall biosynthesis